MFFRFFRIGETYIFTLGFLSNNDGLPKIFCKVSNNIFRGKNNMGDSHENVHYKVKFAKINPHEKSTAFHFVKLNPPEILKNDSWKDIQMIISLHKVLRKLLMDKLIFLS